MSDKPRIYQVLDHFGVAYRDVEYGHKIHCPCHSDTNPSAKVFPATDTLHCFVYNRTFSPEGLYAWLKRVPYRVAKADCARLFPAPITTSLYLESGAVDPHALVASTENPARDFSTLVSAVQRKLVKTGNPEYDRILVKIMSVSKQDMGVAREALTKLASKIGA